LREDVDCRKRPRKTRECAKAHSLLSLNAVDESEKKQEIMSTEQKKGRRQSGRIREKAGNREHWAEEKPETKRTNQRKSRKS